MRDSKIVTLQGFYLFAFLGMGSFLPLLSVYLKEVEKLDGSQIGLIMSLGPIVMMFFQPIWGMVSDYTQAPTRVLALTTFLTGIAGLGYTIFDSYHLFIVIAILVAIFQSAIIPVSDSISLKYATKVKYKYGNIRLYGSLGFGIAVFVMGKLSESIGPSVIFYSLLITLTLASILALIAPSERQTVKVEIIKGMRQLFSYKEYVLFLGVTFTIFAPNLANNTFFGLFVEESGGTYAAIGIAFMVAVFMEIPFMRWSGSFIDRYGYLMVIILAGTVSLARWFLYFFEPSMSIIYLSTIMQGFSLGLFIPAGLQYIKKVAPDHVEASAVTIYAAVGTGLGNWFCTIIGGYLYEYFTIYAVYLFFGLLAFLGIILTFVLYQNERVLNSETPIVKTS
ncbi:MFS transporter [Bacillus carboniphilus]|uniref:MFS transporter n=1 Tax=Bacillus carboniphilus TaxID=86663 RepID=A0ABY9JTM0_9BACI|nr:MFS transporter [Bacillus carboniphilus]WLR42098.1 MFS transporter [Bacillus carboniphilus]